MQIIEKLFGTTCAVCRQKIKGEKFPAPDSGCLCQTCYTKAEIERLVKDMKDETNYFRIMATDKLGEMGPGAITPLVEALVDIRLQCNAEESLKKINRNWARTNAARDAVPTLIAALKDERYGKEDIVEVLGKIADVRAVEPLRELATNYNEYPQARKAARVVLASMGMALERVKPQGTHGLVTLRKNDRVVMKVIACRLGEATKNLAAAILQLGVGRVLTTEQVYSTALLYNFGDKGNLVVVTADECRYDRAAVVSLFDGDSARLIAVCFNKFKDPEFNPLWSEPAVSFIEIVDF